MVKRFVYEGFSPKLLFRQENWFLKVFSKKITKFRSKIAKSVMNENNSFHEYPNAKKFFFFYFQKTFEMSYGLNLSFRSPFFLSIGEYSEKNLAPSYLSF